MKKLALIIGVTVLCGQAMAQDAKTVIADAQRALGGVTSITYSGSARNVAFQQCGGNATALMLLKTDSEPPDALLNRLRARPNIVRVKPLTLPPRG